MYSDKILLENNANGLIHAPDESDDIFIQRCYRAQEKNTPPCCLLAKELFDIEPNWVDVSYSNQQLHFWEGGCTWIEKDRIVLQVRSIFKKKSSYLGYSYQEIVAHELVHVVRNSFEEPIFEEILAYQTSPSFFRRFLGPIFRSSKESLFFIFSLLTICVSTAFSMFQTAVYVGVLGLYIGGGYVYLECNMFFSMSGKKLVKLWERKKL